eukprot:366159-Chlamydomonas_euryale.AAC.5
MLPVTHVTSTLTVTLTRIERCNAHLHARHPALHQDAPPGNDLRPETTRKRQRCKCPPVRSTPATAHGTSGRASGRSGPAPLGRPAAPLPARGKRPASVLTVWMVWGVRQV